MKQIFSSQILANDLKLVENLFLGVATIFQPATLQNVIATDDAGGNSHISVTTGRRVNGIWHRICGNTMFVSVLRRNFSLLSTKKVTAEKQKLRPVFGKFFRKCTYEY